VTTKTDCIQLTTTPHFNSHGFLCCAGHKKPIVGIMFPIFSSNTRIQTVYEHDPTLENIDVKLFPHIHINNHVLALRTVMRIGLCTIGAIEAAKAFGPPLMYGITFLGQEVRAEYPDGMHTSISYKAMLRGYLTNAHTPYITLRTTADRWLTLSIYCRVCLYNTIRHLPNKQQTAEFVNHIRSYTLVPQSP
jgi:hypothetical protein